MGKLDKGYRADLRKTILRQRKKILLKLKKSKYLYDLYLNIEMELMFPFKNIFIISENDKKVKLFLPNKTDFIQRQIILSKTFYEADLLRVLKKYIPKNSTIVDVGSNIGNHVVYYGNILEAKKIYAFEPINDIFNILIKNIELNELTSKVEAYKFALGSENCNASMSHDGKLNNNLGSTSIKKDNIGEICITKLDDIKIEEESIDLIKIDTEGFENEVLNGSVLTIQKYFPIIWIESFGDKYLRAEKFLVENGYFLGERLHDDNYIFLPLQSNKELFLENANIS